ncbi:MAG TPA: hypothetical protein PK614_09995, partial [Nitrospira sp.]|nr:hypothetical protein [Nitrospira sp.]
MDFTGLNQFDHDTARHINAISLQLTHEPPFRPILLELANQYLAFAIPDEDCLTLDIIDKLELLGGSAELNFSGLVHLSSANPE